MTIFRNELCLIRGGGDIATGVVARLHHAGFPIVVTELPFPLAVRRSVSVANAVYEKSTHIENMSVQLVDSVSKAITKSREGIIAVLVNEGIPKLDASIVIDGRLAKKNIDTKIFSKSFKNELVNPLYKNFEELNDFPNCKNNDEVARMLYWDAISYLPGNTIFVLLYIHR